MNSHLSGGQKSRLSLTIFLAAGAVVGGWLLAPEGHTQAPAATTPNAALNAVLAKLKTQQDAIVVNQTKIEAQTALLKENIRQAKIFASRGGSGHR